MLGHIDAFGFEADDITRFTVLSGSKDSSNGLWQTILRTSRENAPCYCRIGACGYKLALSFRQNEKTLEVCGGPEGPGAEYHESGGGARFYVGCTTNRGVGPGDPQ